MRLNYYNKAKFLLETNPEARNVDNRSKSIWVLFKRHTNPNITVLDKNDFVKYFSTFQSFDRAIRDVQQDCPELKWKGNIKNRDLENKVLDHLGY